MRNPAGAGTIVTDDTSQALTKNFNPLTVDA